MQPPRLRKNTRSHELLKVLALGAGALVLSLFSPLALTQLVRAGIRGYRKQKRFERARLVRDLKSLQKRELIEMRDLGSGSVSLTITAKGKEKVLLYNLDSLTLKKPRRWDGKWRLVLFDIPHEHRRARDAFRGKLWDLKFYRLQKSVFITPYPCEEEIDFIASLFNVRQCVLILSVDHFEGEKTLRRYFNLSS